jgi:hypothetical protein
MKLSAESQVKELGEDKHDTRYKDKLRTKIHGYEELIIKFYTLQ